MIAERSDTLVLFGATGDLARKKILPSLYRMVQRGVLKEPVIGVALEQWSAQQMIDRAHEAVAAAGGVDEGVFAAFASLLRYCGGDYRDPATFEKLRETLGTARRPL